MGHVAEDRPRAAYLADVLKALAHPERLRIVAVLCERETNVTGLAAQLGLQQAIVSQHLRILRMSGLVAARRRDGCSTYALAQPRLKELVACLESCPEDTKTTARNRDEDGENRLPAPSAKKTAAAQRHGGGKG
jgi:DNA-binding transcriptional ArsR family regulator